MTEELDQINIFAVRLSTLCKKIYLAGWFCPLTHANEIFNKFIKFLENVSEEYFNSLPNEVTSFYLDVCNFFNTVHEMPKIIIDGFTLEEIIDYNLPVDENYFELDGEITVLHPRLSQHSFSLNYRNYVKALDETLLPNPKSRIYDYEKLKNRKAKPRGSKKTHSSKFLFQALGEETLRDFISKIVIEYPDITTNELHQILKSKGVDSIPRSISTLRLNTLVVLRQMADLGKISDMDYVSKIYAAKYVPVQEAKKKTEREKSRKYYKKQKTNKPDKRKERYQKLEKQAIERFNNAIEEQESNK